MKSGQASATPAASVASMSLSPSSQTKAEANSGTTNFDYTVTVVRGSNTGDLYLNWSVYGSGTNPANNSDFVGVGGSLTILAGSSTATITVPVKGDTDFEADETFTLLATIAGIGSATATGTITNDDTAPAITYRTIVVEVTQSFSPGSAAYMQFNEIGGYDSTNDFISRVGATASQNYTNGDDHSADKAIDGDIATFAQMDGGTGPWQYIINYPNGIRPLGLRVLSGSIRAGAMTVRLFAAGATVPAPGSPGGVTVFTGAQADNNSYQNLAFTYPSGT